MPSINVLLISRIAMPRYFRIIGNLSQYLDLYDHFCYFKVKIQDKDNKDILDTEDVSTTNNLFHTMFSNCDVSISNQLVSTSNNCYMYKSYLETLLSYEKQYLESQGTTPTVLRRH